MAYKYSTVKGTYNVTMADVKAYEEAMVLCNEQYPQLKIAEATLRGYVNATKKWLQATDFVASDELCEQYSAARIASGLSQRTVNRDKNGLHRFLTFIANMHGSTQDTNSEPAKAIEEHTVIELPGPTQDNDTTNNSMVSVHLGTILNDIVSEYGIEAVRSILNI